MKIRKRLNAISSVIFNDNNVRESFIIADQFNYISENGYDILFQNFINFKRKHLIKSDICKALKLSAAIGHLTIVHSIVSKYTETISYPRSINNALKLAQKNEHKKVIQYLSCILEKLNNIICKSIIHDMKY